MAGVTSKAEGSQEDEWTLERWQSNHKQHFRKKKSRRCNEPGVEEPSLLLTLSGTVATCTLNSAPGIDKVEEPLVQDITSREGDELGHNELKGSKDFSSELPENAVAIIGKDQDVQDSSSPLCGASLACTMDRLILEDESEIDASKAPSPKKPQEVKIETPPWVLKQCKKAPPFNSAGPKTENLSKLDAESKSIECDPQKKQDSEELHGILVPEDCGPITEVRDSAKDMSSRSKNFLEITHYLQRCRPHLVGKKEDKSSELPLCLYATETLNGEEDEEFHKPAKLPCKRKVSCGV